LYGLRETVPFDPSAQPTTLADLAARLGAEGGDADAAHDARIFEQSGMMVSVTAAVATALLALILIRSSRRLQVRGRVSLPGAAALALVATMIASFVFVTHAPFDTMTPGPAIFEQWAGVILALVGLRHLSVERDASFVQALLPAARVIA
jgi:hypothetical protein